MAGPDGGQVLVSIPPGGQKCNQAQRQRQAASWPGAPAGSGPGAVIPSVCPHDFFGPRRRLWRSKQVRRPAAKNPAHLHQQVNGISDWLPSKRGSLHSLIVRFYYTALGLACQSSICGYFQQSAIFFKGRPPNREPAPQGRTTKIGSALPSSAGECIQTPKTAGHPIEGWAAVCRLAAARIASNHLIPIAAEMTIRCTSLVPS